MKVVMVGPDSKAQGGMATVIDNFKKEYHGPTKLIFVSSWVAGSRIKQMLKGMRQVITLLKQKSPDAFHFHVAEKGSFYRKSFYLFLIPNKIPIIFHMHAAEFDDFYNQASKLSKKYIRYIFNKVTTIVALSEEWRNFYQGLTNTEVLVIENAVRVPKEFSYKVDSKIVTTFGRVGQRKGSYDTFQVAKKVWDVDPDIQFVLYGDGEKDIEILEEKCRNEKVKNFKLGGWLTDKKQKLEETALHLLPSYHEGVPMAILETMAHGIPNLTTNVGGIPQVVKNNENGFVVTPGDVDLMTESIIAFFRDEFLRKSFSEKAREIIIRNHSIDSYFVKWDELYTKIQKGDSKVL